MKKYTISPLVLVLLCGGLLAACGGEHQEVRAWMQQERAEARPAIKPLPEPKPYKAVSYVPPVGIEPFAAARLLQAINAANANNPTSELYRTVVQSHRKQPLEAYPLDSLQYVGMLEKGGKKIALIQMETLLYQVRTGDFMGLNYGRIMRIEEGQLALREVIQDATGDWVERDTTLDLQEGSKK